MYGLTIPIIAALADLAYSAPATTSSASPALASTGFNSSVPAPYTPSGGFDTNGSLPVYAPLSDFDYQSLNLALYQELIELDLFHNGLAKFPVEEFEAAGINAADRFVIEFMADQEIGHATAIANMIGPNNASRSCEYSYPFETVREFINFNEFLTRFGEAGTYGFLEHLNSRSAAQIVLQAVTTEARQEMIFRQLQGIFPMPYWFNMAITQSMQWTLMAPYIVGCPDDNIRVEFQNFPALTVKNQPNVTELSGFATPATSRNQTAFTQAGDVVYLEWETPGKAVGPNASYITNTTAGEPKFVAWISQLNTTYTPLVNVSGNCGATIQPGGSIYGTGTKYTDGPTAPLINGTVFLAVVDEALAVTPANLSFLNSHVVAGPAAYFSG